MKRGWNIVSVFVFVLMVSTMTGCSSPKESAPTVNDEQAKLQARLERGRYLVEGVAACFACHAEVDWKALGAPPLAEKKGGGAVFPEELPFRVVASNITPDRETGVGAWTDEQLARAIRDGIGQDGRRLFPIMPYMSYRGLSDEDLASIIAYLRSIPPVRNELPKTELPEPVKQLLPPPLPPVTNVAPPDMSDPVKRGAYLAQLADCQGCHTPMNLQTMQPIQMLAFAGGRTIKGPWGEVAPSNITPDASGISYYDEALFLQVMRTGHVKARTLNSLMLWGYYRNMTDDDLKAIFAYLRTLPLVKHRVDNTEPPTPCKLCGFTHGLGADNK